MEAGENTAFTKSLCPDLGDPIVYDEPLSEEALQEYEERLEDYDQAHAEVEAVLCSLPAD